MPGTSSAFLCAALMCLCTLRTMLCTFRGLGAILSTTFNGMLLTVSSVKFTTLDRRGLTWYDPRGSSLCHAADCRI